jgi:hypothetical protein
MFDFLFQMLTLKFSQISSKYNILVYNSIFSYINTTLNHIIIIQFLLYIKKIN